MEEHRYRSIIKGFTWRVVATADTILIAWLITGEIKFALSIGGIEVVTKLVLYYLHERTWNKVKLGRRTDVIDYQI